MGQKYYLLSIICYYFFALVTNIHGHPEENIS